MKCECTCACIWRGRRDRGDIVDIPEDEMKRQFVKDHFRPLDPTAHPDADGDDIPYTREQIEQMLADRGAKPRRGARKADLWRQLQEIDRPYRGERTEGAEGTESANGIEQPDLIPPGE